MNLVKIDLQYVLYMEKKKRGEDGKCPVSICITYKSRRTYIISGIRLLPECWDQFGQKVMGDDDAFSKKANKLLLARLKKIQKNPNKYLRILTGHKQCSILENYLKKSVHTKNGGTDEGK